MEEERDGERGEGEGGAHRWLLEKLNRFSTDSASPFSEHFFGVTSDGRAVWQGHLVEDDRNAKEIFRVTFGADVDIFWGLLNTRPEMRGRGVGWRGAQYMDNWIQRRTVELGLPKVTAGLFTDNPAAVRHYVALGYSLLGEISVGFEGESQLSMAYSKDYFGNAGRINT